MPTRLKISTGKGIRPVWIGVLGLVIVLSTNPPQISKIIFQTWVFRMTVNTALQSLWRFMDQQRVNILTGRGQTSFSMSGTILRTSFFSCFTLIIARPDLLCGASTPNTPATRIDLKGHILANEATVREDNTAERGM